MELMNKTQKNTVLLICIAAILLPVLFFGAILVFRISGLPLYFTQLGLYAAFYLLAFWGMKSSGIRLNVANGRLLWQSLAVLVLSWLFYVLVISVFKIVNLPQEVQTLGSASLWKIAANILSTWFFVGTAEEVLFRGFFLKKLVAYYEERKSARTTLWAVLVSSAFFSLWHLPVRLYLLFNGGISIGMILVSLVVLFVLGTGFAWLFLRSGRILLTGVVHGVLDYPLIGGDSQFSFMMLIAAIGLVEIARLVRRKKTGLDEF